MQPPGPPLPPGLPTWKPTDRRTHCKPESKGQAGKWQSEYHDTMIDHDKVVGALLDLIDELGLTGETIVQYSTDNGPHFNTWPDSGTTPFRSEKNSGGCKPHRRQSSTAAALRYAAASPLVVAAHTNICRPGRAEDC